MKESVSLHVLKARFGYPSPSLSSTHNEPSPTYGDTHCVNRSMQIDIHMYNNYYYGTAKEGTSIHFSIFIEGHV